jgi:lysophospholipase L1-like esterase
MERLPALVTVALACLALADVGAGTAAADVDDVLVIGDSLGVGGETALERALAGADVTTDARVGRASGEGVEILADAIAPEHDVVVFALGSNDDPAFPQTLADNLGRASALAGGRCMVVSTISIPPVNGYPDDPLNAVIRGFAEANPNVRLVEWERAVNADPGILSDGAHATAEGYELRASMIAEAIASCETEAGGLPRNDGIPNPDRDALAEGRARPEAAPAPQPSREPISRERALEVLADALASQIAIGALEISG